ncbi:MAG: hypothetical protein ABJA66_17265 [Actinomycetota bacterium]
MASELEFEARLAQIENRMAAQSLLKERLTRLDGQIRYEADLIAQRVTYLAASESFLFSAYAITLVNFDNVKTFKRQAEFLVEILPWVGLSLALGVLLGVSAAVFVTYKMKTERAKCDVESLKIDNVVDWKSVPNFLGLIPPVLVPVAFITAWLYVRSAEAFYLITFSIAFLTIALGLASVFKYLAKDVRKHSTKN